MANYGATNWREAWQIRSARLGVALAVIRSRAVGTSGREHAEELSAKVRHQEQEWRSRAQELTGEVLSLRQELMITKVLSKQKPGAELMRGDDVLKLFSQDLTEAPLSENDSGCDTQTLSQTPDPADAVLSSTLPPYFTQTCRSSFHRGTQECVLSKHMQFLQNLSALRGSVRNTQMDRGDVVIEDTALNMIKFVVEAHREAGGGRSGDVSQMGRLVQASLLVAQALERGVSTPKVLEKAEDLLEELLQLLLNNSQLKKFAVQDNLTECLICLGGASMLRSGLIKLVLSHIIRLAEHLWSVCQIISSPSTQLECVRSKQEQRKYYVYRLRIFVRLSRLDLMRR